jgi:hypothetical protein
MALQYGTTLRNNQLDQVESTVGTAPKLQLRSGAPPATCATADSGTMLCELTLPSDWMAAASGGTKAKSGTWSGTGAAAGSMAHFRVKDSAGTTCHIQGTVTATGGGGDMTVDNVVVAIGQTVTVNTFTLTAGNS